MPILYIYRGWNGQQRQVNKPCVLYGDSTLPLIVALCSLLAREQLKFWPWVMQLKSVETRGHSPAVVNMGIVHSGKMHWSYSVPQIPIPSVPTYQPATTVPHRLEAIQRYIRDLQYPFPRFPGFCLRLSKPIEWPCGEGRWYWNRQGNSARCYYS